MGELIKSLFRQLLFGEHELNSSTPIDCNDVGKCNPEPFTRKPAKIIVHKGYEFKKNRGANPNDIGKKRYYFLTSLFIFMTIFDNFIFFSAYKT